MKKINLLYWISTGLMSAFVLLGAIIDASMAPDAVTLIQHLGYPVYFVPFIGIAKILAVFVILVPRFQRLKEWAYAGLVFDISGALYSHLSVKDPVNVWFPAVIALVLVLTSYIAFRFRSYHMHIE